MSSKKPNKNAPNPAVIFKIIPNKNISLKVKLKTFLKETTLITVTHRLPVLELVDRIIVLADGKIALDGPKNEVLEKLQTKQ